MQIGVVVRKKLLMIIRLKLILITCLPKMRTINILLMLAFTNLLCYGQSSLNQDSIKLFYHHGVDGIGDINRCVIISYNDDTLFCQRIIYHRKFLHKYYSENLAYKDNMTLSVLRYFQDKNNYQIIEDRKKITESQLHEFKEIVHEIESFVSDDGVSTSMNYYVIEENNKTAVIIDWLGQFNKCHDIEKVLDLDNPIELKR